MRSIHRFLLPLALVSALAACSSDEPEAPAAEPMAEEPAKPAVEAIKPVVPTLPPEGVVNASGPVVDPHIVDGLGFWLQHPLRSAQNKARDIYRHPLETLSFFGLQQKMSVVEITPGAGWYTEILGPLMKSQGQYAVAIWNDKLPDQPAYRAQLNKELLLRLRAPKFFGKTEVRRFDARNPSFGPAGSADMVLSFRNAHNWVEEGTAPAYFKAMATVLKSGGVLGMVDHRAPTGDPTDGKSGYVTEEQIIDLAIGAGLVFVEKSEINANPKDTKDYTDGVWTLPPTLALGEQDKEKYLAIGESDRMTLKFVKP